MLAAAIVMSASAPPRECQKYEHQVFTGRITHLRLRRSTPRAWSAEDPFCDRLFFPAKLSPTLNANVARRITASLNRYRAPSDDYVEIDATVRIVMDADRSGGTLTVISADQH
jgi:hypothetical protein